MQHDRINHNIYNDIRHRANDIPCRSTNTIGTTQMVRDMGISKPLYYTNSNMVQYTVIYH